MRKNLAKHTAKKLPLAKRVLALCFALIFVCSCLLPAFANGTGVELDTPDTEVVEAADPGTEPEPMDLYLSLIAVTITIIVITRLKNSRVGMALQAMREDEIASEAMGINLTQVKLTAFALSSAWAGFAGVLFAAKTQFINPASFTFMDSCMILAMVVLGGMGSILGVTIGALILILVPEYLRAFSDYRMLLFGATMVVMMLFRPQGIITGEKRHYRISALHNKEERA